MKHCEEMNLEMTPQGAIFKGQRWPQEIKVERNLLDYLPGPHVVFGRAGILRFSAVNGYAIYRRAEDIPGPGWRYELTGEHQLKAEVPEGHKPELRPRKAEKVYRHNDSDAPVSAFQWLPDAVPSVDLPEWFLRSDFQHVAAKGQLILRDPKGQPRTVVSGDWVVHTATGALYPMSSKTFSENYHEV